MKRKGDEPAQNYRAGKKNFLRRNFSFRPGSFFFRRTLYDGKAPPLSYRDALAVDGCASRSSCTATESEA